jgi:hypothetical protein
MKLKYLLTMHCKEQGYWDTSGYCEWREDAFHRHEEFDLDDEEGLIKAIASFTEKYPRGEYEIYIVQPYNDWSYDDPEWEKYKDQEDKINEIMQKSFNLTEKIKKEKRSKEIAEKKAETEKETARLKEHELETLRKLKEKYEKIQQ